MAAADARPDPETANRCDVLVVGGGINGASIARDLAGRGLKVLLCERDDLAQHTSSNSTKLIHGGLRYLEHREFRLVRKALGEREVLLKSAPHIMWPLRFVMPHDEGMRPAWLIRLGLFLYDHLARREVLPGSHGVDLRRHPAGAPLKDRYTRGFVYSDGWVDDARFVVLNAVDARERGAEVLTRWSCERADRGARQWTAHLAGGPDGRRTRQVQARALVNAAGPWAAQFLNERCLDARQAAPPAQRRLRLVKGSHIVVRQRFDHGHAYIFQNPDRRIIFAIPYERDFTLIGTTDVEHLGPPGDLRVDEAEVAYLCEQASRYFAEPVRPEDVVWRYSGVRPLLDDASGRPSEITRDYALEMDDRGGAPLLSIWGGKITTCRKLAEEASDLLAAALGATGPAWTRGAPLPGGDLTGLIGAPQRPDTDFARLEQALARKHPGLPGPLLHRLARAYGSRVDRLIEEGGGLGAAVAGDLHEAELLYLYRHEWARCADDVLWRRGKLGLHFDADQRAAVADWCRSHWGKGVSAS